MAIEKEEKRLMMEKEKAMKSPRSESSDGVPVSPRRKMFINKIVVPLKKKDHGKDRGAGE